MDPKEKKPELLPSHFTKSKLWRFLLDTKADAPHPDEPRFKQFSENLRNFAVAAVLFKAAQYIGFGHHNIFMLVGRCLLYVLASATTLFCLLQLFGLVIIAFHWYIGWETIDWIMRNRTREQRELYEMVAKKKLYLRATVKTYALMLVPFLFLWAMLAFVFSPIR